VLDETPIFEQGSNYNYFRPLNPEAKKLAVAYGNGRTISRAAVLVIQERGLKLDIKPFIRKSERDAQARQWFEKTGTLSQDMADY